MASFLKWKKGISDWFTFLVQDIARLARRDKNLSDLDNIPEARKNLDLIGNNNSTHFHDKYMNDIGREKTLRLSFDAGAEFSRKYGDKRILDKLNNSHIYVSGDANGGAKFVLGGTTYINVSIPGLVPPIIIRPVDPPEPPPLPPQPQEVLIFEVTDETFYCRYGYNCHSYELGQTWNFNSPAAGTGYVEYTITGDEKKHPLNNKPGGDFPNYVHYKIKGFHDVFLNGNNVSYSGQQARNYTKTGKVKVQLNQGNNTLQLFLDGDDYTGALVSFQHYRVTILQ